MLRLRIFVIVLTALFSFAYAQSLSLITPAEAIHLVEYKLKDLDAGRFKATSVSYDDEKCTVSGTNGAYPLAAVVDARAARVLELKRNGETFYTWEGIKVVGHRGTVKFAPENTIPAFLKAIELGADLLEMDVRETKDSVLVIMHDDKVDRTTNGTGRVAEMTLAEIKALDAGSWFGDDFKGVKVPTFREVLAAIRGKALPDIYFKAGDPARLIAVLEEENLLGKVTLYCGNWDLMQRTLRLAPEGFFLRPTSPGGRQGLPIVLEKFDPQIVNINWHEFSEGVIQDIHVAGKKSFLNAMQRDTDFVRNLMIETLPDYLQSDHLDLLVPELRQRGLHR